MTRSRRGEKVTPNLACDTEATRVLNLNVLRRLDAAVSDILITAAHVVAYNFDADAGEWVRCLSPAPPASDFLVLAIPNNSLNTWFLQSRKRVEGSLFIVKRFVLWSCVLPRGAIDFWVNTCRKT